MSRSTEQALAEDAASSPASDAIAEQIRSIWQQVLGLESIEPGQNYFDLGGDSSLAVQMFAHIEEVFGIKLPLATLYDAPTVEELASILGGEGGTSGWSPLVSIQPKGSRPPFFCFHGAGGNVLTYRDLSQRLGPDQPFYGLQSPGMDGTCAPLTTIKDMAAAYVKEIRRVQPHGPYYLGGYCMGGTVAYEAAQQIQAQGEPVALLALLDTMNWHLIPLNLWSRSSYNLQRLIFHAASFLSLDMAGKNRLLKEKMEVLRHRIPVWRSILLAKLGKRPSQVASDSLALGKIWQTNDRASWTYLPQPFVGKILDVRPMKQYHVFSKAGLKWDNLARGGVETVVLPVYPSNMLLEPFVEQLAAVLRKSLDDAMQPSTATPR
jgi:phthiocerol/phenolphthiocerol synthesis type-I polyketide synthase E